MTAWAKRRRVFALFVFALLCGCTRLRGAGRPATRESTFRVGERLTYRLYWGVIPVGTAVMSTRWVREGDRLYIRIDATARTSRILDPIFPVDDLVQTIVDPDDLVPVRYEERIREGRYRRHSRTTFYPDTGEAVYESVSSGRRKRVSVEPGTRDVLSMMYHMRMVGMEAGQSLLKRVYVQDKVYPLRLEALGVGFVRIPGGRRAPCIKIEPRGEFGTISTRNGTIAAWFTNDRRRILVRMEGRVSVASVRAVLTRIEGPVPKEAGKG
ncbi:MAG: DUF3108 domain-containing protein [Lentisphaerae bacterium]|nr:DUF3108 domain-containing protein [Lentisphaerota bacterium]